MDKYMRRIARGMVVAALFAGAAAAQAAGYCSLGTATEGIVVGNMSFNAQIAADCYGVVTGNITANAGSDANSLGLSWGADWTYLDATDAASNTFMGLQFTVTETGTTSGTWILTGVDTNGSAALNFPTTLDFVVGLKGGNEFALWGFENAVVDGNDAGTFQIVFTNKGGNVPALSHLIVFARAAEAGTILPAPPVPEPESYAMLLAGLGLVAWGARRKA